MHVSSTDMCLTPSSSAEGCAESDGEDLKQVWMLQRQGRDPGDCQPQHCGKAPKITLAGGKVWYGGEHVIKRGLWDFLLLLLLERPRESSPKCILVFPSAGWSQGLTHAKCTLYYWATAPAPERVLYGSVSKCGM